MQVISLFHGNFLQVKSVLHGNFLQVVCPQSPLWRGSKNAEK